MTYQDWIQFIQSIIAIIAGLVAIAAVWRWRSELRHKTRHEAAQSAIKSVMNIPSVIAVARRSFSTVFFTDEPSKLRNPETVKEYKKSATFEKSFWEDHLKIMYDAGVQLRNSSIIPEIIWGDKYGSPIEELKKIIDKWVNAVSGRLENLNLFLETVHPSYLNKKWSPILINEEHYEQSDYFQSLNRSELAKTSVDFFNQLKEVCRRVCQVIDPSFLK